MGNVAAAISSLGLTDLYKYVFNSMECHSHCCKDFITCDCETKEVEVDSDPGCASLCCLDDPEGYTSSSREEENID